MNKFSVIATVILGAFALTSCLDDDEENRTYGFLVYKPYNEATGLSLAYLYANPAVDSLCFVSYGSWTMSDINGSEWVTMPAEAYSGKGYIIYSFPAALAGNTTGEARFAVFQLSDSEKPDKGSAQIGYYQYATRSDGAYGWAPLVRNISGSDGSEIAITYDERLRPLSITMSKDSFKRAITFSYDIDHSSSNYERVTALQTDYTFEYKDTLYSCGSITLTGLYSPLSTKSGMTMTSNYLVSLLSDLSSTGGGSMNKKWESGSSSMDISAQTAYQSFVENYYGLYNIDFETAMAMFDECGPVYRRQQMIEVDGSLAPDSIHMADSIILNQHYPDATTVNSNFGVTYSRYDNRKQNIDVNQLLWGVADCSPYALLGFFPLARQSRIIAEASFLSAYGVDGAGKATIDAELGSDGRVSILHVVSDSRTDLEGVTYTFEYY